MAAAIVLCEDERGIPRSLPLLAALVEQEARLHAAAASQPARSDLVCAFRGGSVPNVPIREFLERIHLLVRSEAAAGHVIRIDGTCFVLAGVYLTRFIGSYAARVAGIVVEPSTAHRLVAVALFLGGHSPRNWAAVFEATSGRVIRAGEIVGLEEMFLRAISSRLFVDGHEFRCFCGLLEKVPLPPSGSCAGRKRRAEAVGGDEEEEHRRVRACVCLPPPAVAQGFEKKTWNHVAVRHQGPSGVFKLVSCSSVFILLRAVIRRCCWCHRQSAVRRRWCGRRLKCSPQDVQESIGVKSPRDASFSSSARCWSPSGDK